MNWFQRLAGFKPAAPGLEWALWKRLPAILAWGTAVPLAVAGLAWSAMAQERDAMLWVYPLIGLVILHWTLVFTVAIGCAIVIVMKGPAYVADAYPPPGREPPG